MKKSRLLSVVCTYLSIVSLNANAATFDNFLVPIGNDHLQGNGVSNTFTNNLTVDGRWFLSATSLNTNMIFEGTQIVGGTGEIILSDSANNRWLGDATNTITVGSGLIVRGAGKIGLNLPNIINDGTFLAQGSNAELLIQSTSFTNNGVLRAEGSQGLHLSGVNLSNNTSVDVNSGSALQLTSSNVNGIFEIANGATATASSTVFDAVTINGDMQQDNFNNNDFKNGLTLNGTWNLNATSGTTDMNFQGTQSIGGIGEIVMSDNINNRISGDLNVLTVGRNITIRGAGKIGLNSDIINEGNIFATGVNAELRIQGGDFINNEFAALRAQGSKGINITSLSFTNHGVVEVEEDSTIIRTGTYVQNDGGLTLNNGVFEADLFHFIGGNWGGDGIFIGDVLNEGLSDPGNSPGLLSIDGGYTQTVFGILAIELGGLNAGTEYDVLDITGTASLAGTLDVDLFDLGDGLFEPSLGDSFDILLAETISGSFDTLLLATLGGGLSLDISYLTDEIGSMDVVRLSVVSSVPIPPTLYLFGSGLIGLVGMARRKIAA